ncbi:MAG: ThiF family adenylyltransferase [Candidatus Neomarinimicrobiota bacterium]
MIITPKVLNEQKDDFTIIDIRSDEERQNFPLLGLDTILSSYDQNIDVAGKKVLICQFGIVTEGMIIEKNINNAFSLLGGAQAWVEYYNENEDLSRWARQTVLPEIGIEGQKKLLNSHVSIIGMGGLGCPVAQSLVIAGIGKLKLIDNDIVSISNLHRQPLYSFEDVNKKKVLAAESKLKILNPEVIIETDDIFFDDINGEELLLKTDVIIDATDNIKSRQKIDKISKKLKIPTVYGALFRFEGQVSILNVDGSAGYSDLFPSSNTYGEDSCADAGVLSMLPAIIGNIQALEAIKLILGINNNLIGRLLMYDGMNHKTEVIEL